MAAFFPEGVSRAVYGKAPAKVSRRGKWSLKTSTSLLPLLLSHFSLSLSLCLSLPADFPSETVSEIVYAGPANETWTRASANKRLNFSLSLSVRPFNWNQAPLAIINPRTWRVDCRLKNYLPARYIGRSSSFVYFATGGSAKFSLSIWARWDEQSSKIIVRYW